MHIISNRWIDQTFWEADIPDSWEVAESSAQHIRITHLKAKALIGFRKGVESKNGEPIKSSPPVLSQYTDEFAYSMTRNEAAMPHYPSLYHDRIMDEKMQLGMATGYAYNHSTMPKDGLW